MNATAAPLFHHRCAIHHDREAVARCPECGRDYCRECVTEHADRLICAACLRKLAAPAARRKVSFAGLIRLVQCLAGLVLCWMFFYYLGQSLLAMPSSFHEGTIWEKPFAEHDEP